MAKEQLIKEATFVCCPMCDKEKCVGRFKCEEIKRYVEEVARRKEEALRKLKELENENI